MIEAIKIALIVLILTPIAWIAIGLLMKFDLLIGG